MTLGELVTAIGKFYLGAKAVGSAMSDLRGTSVAIAEHSASDAPKLTKHRVRTLDDRMVHIRRLTRKGVDDPHMRQVVAKILTRRCGKDYCVPEKNHEAEVRAIFDYVHAHTRYTRDIYNVDTFQSPRRTLEMGIMDCDDASILLACLLLVAGYPAKFRVIQVKGESDWSHIFVLVGLPPGNPTRWVALDASVRKPAGWHPPRSMIVRTRDFDA